MARRLTADEARAWSRVAATIKPIGPHSEAFTEALAALEAGPADPPPQAPVPLRPEARTNVARTAPPPADRGDERRVRRGQLSIAASFDLHGHTQTSAARALPGFLARQQEDGARCVLVITGKGRDGKGILRRNFLIWLESPAARDLVSGYGEAHIKHGGTGAFYVFLRRADP